MVPLGRLEGYDGGAAKNAKIAILTRSDSAVTQRAMPPRIVLRDIKDDEETYIASD